MAELLTLDEYKIARGISLADTSRDDEITLYIQWASAVVRNFTDRDFASATVTETRTYPYDGSGILEIDDATAVTNVNLLSPPAAPLTLNTDEWYVAPQGGPIYSYIYIAAIGPGYMSPEMGFPWNYDRLWQEGRFRFAPLQLEVTGTFGWAVVPDDVKQAVVWIIEDWESRREGEGLTSESIADYSRSWGGRIQGASGRPQALPDRAMDLLAHYQKIYV